MEIKTVILLLIASSILYLLLRGSGSSAKAKGIRPNIHVSGSPEFRQAVNEALDIIATTSSASIANRLTSITEARRDHADRRHAHVYSRGNCTIFPRGWREVSRQELAATIVHEGAHVGTHGEAPALAAEAQFNAEVYAHGSARRGTTVDDTGRPMGPQDWYQGMVDDVPANHISGVGAPFTPREMAAIEQSFREDGSVYFTGENGQRLWAYGVGMGKGTVRAINERGTAGRLLKMRRP
jgi:hypothetical protein